MDPVCHLRPLPEGLSAPPHSLRCASARSAGACICDSPCALSHIGAIPSIRAQVSQIAISARICKNVGTESLPEHLLQYDSRVDCLSAEYASYSVYFWIMAVLWPVGCPAVLLLLLKLYRVPEIAARKLRQAKIRAFVLHSMAKASEIGVSWTEASAESHPSFDEMGLPLLMLLLALPSLWARLRRLPAAIIADLDDRRLRWTLFAVFLLYPKVRALIS